MPFACSACARNLPVGADRRGDKLRCPWCGVRVTVGAPPSAVATAPDSPATPRRREPLPASAGTGPGLLIAAVAGAAALGLLFLGLAAFTLFLLTRPAPAPVLAEAARTPPPQAESDRPNDDRHGSRTAQRSPVVPPAEGGPVRATPRGAEPPALGGNKFAEFFGTKAMGSRFCIIADCSGSMTANRRMDRLKDELKKTLNDLAPDQEFYVLFFHSRAEPMPQASWLRGGKDVETVLPWIDRQKPRGGTQPMTAFEAALRLEPRPDVIFFMTDGIIPQDVPRRVKALNAKGTRVQINAILFGGEGPVPAQPKGKMTEAMQKRFEQMKQRFEQMKERGEKMLKELADDSGGTYRYVPDGLVPNR